MKAHVSGILDKCGMADRRARSMDMDDFLK